MSQEPTREELLEQFEKLHERARQLQLRTFHRSSINVQMEAKRFAKTNRLLVEYLYSCYMIAGITQVELFGLEQGLDCAMEVIAYLESPEKAKKLQNDYDPDEYESMVRGFLVSGYDSLSVLTALKSGYNSPVVYGAVDDGLQVGRRVGDIGAPYAFLEFSTRACLASGDFEMGEYHARRRIECTGEEAANERYMGLCDLNELCIAQGKLGAALGCLDAVYDYADRYHDPEFARKMSFLRAERLYWLAGKEDEFPKFAKKNRYNGVPELPPREECGSVAWEYTLAEAVKLARREKFLDAARLLGAFDECLLAENVMHWWFLIRVARIANLRMAREAGQPVTDDIGQLTLQTRQRAAEACHWSAINSLDAMESGAVRLNPLGIALPIDLGPYATPGTRVSSARLNTVEPFPQWHTEESPSPETDSTNTDSTNTGDVPAEEDGQEKRHSALYDDAMERYNRLVALHTELLRFDEERQDAGNGDGAPEAAFPRQAELNAVIAEITERSLAATPRTHASLTFDEFHALACPFAGVLIPVGSELAPRVWNWVESFASVFKEDSRYLVVTALVAQGIRDTNKETELPFLPAVEEVIRRVEQAVKRAPNSHEAVSVAALIAMKNRRMREAQYYFARACQLDRTDAFSTHSLARLYVEADRPKDAVAVIDLYCRAGGRHLQLLVQAMHTAIGNSMPQAFLLFYTAFIEATGDHVDLFEAWRIQALLETEQYAETLEALDQCDETKKSESPDRMLIRALCLAKTEKEWLEPFDAAVRTIRDGAIGDGSLGERYDPCQPLWDYVAAKLPDSDERRKTFDRFILERGLAPMSYFSPENRGTEATPEAEEAGQKPLWRVLLAQSLVPSVPAFQGWSEIPTDTPAYHALWFVVADTQEEARYLALLWQSKCYSAAPCAVLEMEQYGEYPRNTSGVLGQSGRGVPREEKGSNI